MAAAQPPAAPVPLPKASLLALLSATMSYSEPADGRQHAVSTSCAHALLQALALQPPCNPAALGSALGVSFPHASGSVVHKSTAALFNVSGDSASAARGVVRHQLRAGLLLTPPLRCTVCASGAASAQHGRRRAAGRDCRRAGAAATVPRAGLLRRAALDRLHASPPGTTLHWERSSCNRQKYPQQVSLAPPAPSAETASQSAAPASSHLSSRPPRTSPAASTVRRSVPSVKSGQAAAASESTSSAPRAEEAASGLAASQSLSQSLSTSSGCAPPPPVERASALGSPKKPVFELVSKTGTQCVAGARLGP